ncbi:response regulator, partial [bacterium]|nr:response regulator [bacterium]
MGQAHLLIIEDEANLRKVIQRFFEVSGYKATLAADGQEGLAKFENSPDIDLVLADIRLPKMDGLEVLSEIKKRDSSVQVILMTGYS